MISAIKWIWDQIVKPSIGPLAGAGASYWMGKKLSENRPRRTRQSIERMMDAMDMIEKRREPARIKRRDEMMGRINQIFDHHMGPSVVPSSTVRNEELRAALNLAPLRKKNLGAIAARVANRGLN